MIFHSIKSIPVDDISESPLPQTGVEPLPVVPEALCHVLRLGDGRHVGSHDDPGVQPERVRLLQRRDVVVAVLFNLAFTMLSTVILKAFVD